MFYVLWLDYDYYMSIAFKCFGVIYAVCIAKVNKIYMGTAREIVVKYAVKIYTLQSTYITIGYPEDAH